MATKINCWEFNHCGREPGGKKALEHGVCPAATDESSSGVNSGLAGGRFCWAISGTLCGGKAQGTFALKRETCLTCSFFKLVRSEEEPDRYVVQRSS